MQLIEHFLPNKEFNNLQQFFMGPYIPWILNNTITNSETSIVSGYQFTHTFHNNADLLLEQPESQFKPFLRNFLWKLRPSNIFRVKANLRPSTTEIEGSGFHSDLPVKYVQCKTAIYYINTCNGYTEFEKDHTQVRSVANRLIVFDSSDRHMGTTCTDKNVRVVLNVNYLESYENGKPHKLKSAVSYKNNINF